MDWKTFLAVEPHRWANTNKAWIETFKETMYEDKLALTQTPGKKRKRRLLVVRYEDLVSSTERQLRRVLTFLGHDAGDDAIRCTLRERKEGPFHRALASRRERDEQGRFSEEVSDLLHRRMAEVDKIIEKAEEDSQLLYSYYTRGRVLL